MWRRRSPLLLLLIITLFFCLTTFLFMDEADMNQQINLVKSSPGMLAVLPEKKKPSEPPEMINLILIVCRRRSDQMQNMGEDSTRQVDQTVTLLKTVYLLTSVPVTVYIVHNGKDVFDEVVQGLTRNGVKTGPTFKLVAQEVVYPPGLEAMINMFRFCATARLFLHEMLPHLDAGLFLDTDIIMMDDLKHLWSRFKMFSAAQVLGMMAVESHYSSVHYLPHFGPPGVGLNAGVMLMNLTRMREMSGGGFTGAVRYVFERHKAYLPLADQDILNAMFGYAPWYMHELPCSWNYIVWQCREDFFSPANPRTNPNTNHCYKAGKQGVSLLHGNSLVFYTQLDILFRTIYEFWTKFQVGKHSLTKSGEAIRARIRKIIDRKDVRSECAKVPNIEQVMVGRLEVVLAGLKEEDGY